jgi:hypothetical protein
MGIPLRPDPLAMQQMQRRSFCRAATALVMAHNRRDTVEPQNILKRAWRDDDDANVIVRAASSPIGTTDTFPQIQSQRVLPMLMADSASGRLLALGTTIDLTGIATVRIPFVPGSGRPQSPAFVGESSPIPVTDLVTNAMVLGPTKKVAIAAALSMELQAGSGESASAIIGAALSISTSQAMDAALFSANATTPISPAGLLFNVPAIPSAGGTGVAGVADDLALLAQQISNNGVETSNLVIITTAALGAKAKVLSGPHFADRILVSGYIPAGMVVALNPAGLATGFAGNAEVTTSTGAAVVMGDATPPPIGTPGTPPTVGAPTLSGWQSGLIILKIVGRCAWCIEPACISVLTGAAW